MDRDIELRHLRYFVAVAEELHFGHAAERLHLSQPPLSQQIRRLEELLGYPLFERTSRSVTLTAAGKAYLERARRTLRLVERDLEETRQIGGGELGSLHIGFVGSAMLTSLPEVFRLYRKNYPGVRLHLHESFTTQVMEGLGNGTLDAGILRDSDTDETENTLHTQTLLSERYLAVLPATHRAAKQNWISPGQLRNDPFVYYPRSAGARAFEKPFAFFEEHGFRPQVVQEASHWLTILRLVGAGLGVSVAPACVKHIASPKEVVCLPLRGVNVNSELQLAYVKGDTRPLVHNFAVLASSLKKR